MYLLDIAALKRLDAALERNNKDGDVIKINVIHNMLCAVLLSVTFLLYDRLDWSTLTAERDWPPLGSMGIYLTVTFGITLAIGLGTYLYLHRKKKKHLSEKENQR